MKKKLKKLFDIILEESENNESFKKKLEDLFEPKVDIKTEKKSKNKREPAVLDPINLAEKDINDLKIKLEELDIEKLKDIVSDYRLDSSRLVMKWKVKERIIEHIIKSALSRAEKGDVFRT